MLSRTMECRDEISYVDTNIRFGGAVRRHRVNRSSCVRSAAGRTGNAALAFAPRCIKRTASRIRCTDRTARIRRERCEH